MRPSDGQPLEVRAPRAGRTTSGIERAAVISLASVLVIEMWTAVAHPLLKGDTVHLVEGASSAVWCLRHHRFTNCDAAPSLPAWSQGQPGTVGPWPLLQYIPAVALRAVGLSRHGTLRVLVALNAAALVALVASVGITVRRVANAVWRPVLDVTLIASPLLLYSTVAFGEALGAAAVVAAVSAALLRSRPVYVVVLVALASMTKETNPVFVCALVAMCTFAVTRSKVDRRSRLIAVAVGTVAGIVANTAFNVFRFGTIRNSIYVQSYERVPNVATAARAFAALWVAPNGGVLWFWPAAIAVLALTTAVSLRHIMREPTWRRAGTVSIAVLLVVQVAGLSTWYSPFGWVAWGPRLMLPLLPAMLLCAVTLGAGDASRALIHFLTTRWFWLGALLAALAALPEAAVVYQPRALNQFFADPLCSNAHVDSNPVRYYRCFDHLAWPKRPLLLQRGLDGLGTPGGALLACTLAVAIVSLLLLARERAWAQR